MRYRVIHLTLALCGLIALPISAAETTKTISYRGGIVAFSIPATWKEEYEPSGGATFYEDRSESGTLRLNVLSASSKDEPAQKMALRVFPSGTYELLANGFPMRYEIKDGDEGGVKLHLHSWSVAVPVPPHSLRLVIFRHAVLAGQESDPLIKTELDFLQQSIRHAVFSQAPGISGDYP
jgi:hypothetical protein